MGSVWRNAHLYPTEGRPEHLWDIFVDGPNIVDVRPAGGPDPAVMGSGEEYDAEGRFVSPPFVDPHIHLDVNHARGDIPANESGTLIEGIQIWAEVKKNLTKDAVKKWAREHIVWKVANGTGLMRSHVDVSDPNLTALSALLELKEEVRDIVDIELIAFPQDGVFTFPEGTELMRAAMALGADIVGGIPHYELTREDGVAEVGFIFDIAKEFGAPVDLHCDETDDEQSRFLEHVAARTIRDGMQGRVVAGHATAMASYNDAYAFKLIQILKRAQVTIVANPLANMVLQGRFDTYPKRRGTTRVKELDAAGVNVACGHDVELDLCYPLGRGSMLDALFMLVHVAQMTSRAQLFRSFDMITRNPARAAGRNWLLEPGRPANFVVLDCGDEIEAIRLRPLPRWVVRDGRVVAETQPSRTRVVGMEWEEEVTFVPSG